MSRDDISRPDGEPLVRPFLERGQARPAPPAPSDGELRGEVRPYLMTGGRTAVPRIDVAMETVVVTVEGAHGALRGGTAFEHARVLAECRAPRSVAEVAARLGVPLVVALIVVADLVGEGLLEASTTVLRQADDIEFLEGLIDGVTAL